MTGPHRPVTGEILTGSGLPQVVSCWCHVHNTAGIAGMTVKVASQRSASAMICFEIPVDPAS